MATPRKHWFRVADSVQYEPWSNDVAATFLRLSAHLNTRWARDGKQGIDAGSVTLSSAVCQALTGSGSLARARRVLNELATHVSLVIDEQGANTSVTWRKFSVFQRYESEPGEEPETVVPLASPPPQDARRKTQDAPARRNEEGEPAAPDAPIRKPKRASKEKTQAPEDLDPAQKAALVAWVRTKEPDAEPELRALVDACLDHFRAKGQPMADWVATCRTWIRNRRRFAPSAVRASPKTFGELKADNQRAAVVGAVALLRGTA